MSILGARARFRAGGEVASRTALADPSIVGVAGAEGAWAAAAEAVLVTDMAMERTGEAGRCTS